MSKQEYTRAEVAEIVEEALSLIGGAWDDLIDGARGVWMDEARAALTAALGEDEE